MQQQSQKWLLPSGILLMFSVSCYDEIWFGQPNYISYPLSLRFRQILSKEHYRRAFATRDEDSILRVNIQTQISGLSNFDTLYAVSITGVEMSTDDFFSQIPSSSGDYEPITDLSIALNDLLVICEVKRNTNDCKWQLFQQAEKAVQNIDAGIKMNDSIVKPVDLNWKKLVEIAMHIHHFHLSTGRPNRFLNDFLNMIRQHDYNWMPINPLSEVGSDNQYALNARLNLALTQSSSETLGVGGRAGFSVSLGWANEVLFGFSKTGNESVFWAAIFPGNTKGQGWPLFHNEQGPIFRDKIVVNGIELSIEKKVHLKFSHFQKYFAELTFDESVCEKPIMTRRNFVNVSGRKKREGNDWKQIQDFFDSHFREDYDWRSKFDGHLDWPGLLKSGKGYFDLSFGYELSVQVPLKVLQELDRRIDDVTAFAQFLDDINAQFSTVLIQE